MKHLKLIIISIVVLLLLLLVASARPLCAYFLGPAYVKSYYGDSYKELLEPTSIASYIHGKKVLKHADKAFSSFMEKEDAEAEFGALSRYCIHTDSYPEAVREKHNLRFIAAHIKHDSGYIWVNYTQKAFDKEGSLVTGSSNVYSRWSVEKQDNQWVVTEIKEHP